MNEEDLRKRFNLKYPKITLKNATVWLFYKEGYEQGKKDRGIMTKNNYEANEPCTACLKEGEGMVTYHHIFTRKVYPEFAEESWNKIPVCKDHHGPGSGKGFHDHGTQWMAENFPPIKKWLHSNGWFFCTIAKKWRREGF